ncbi:MAG: 2'-5' RNA ligase family protein [Sphingobacteriales bacterium]|nr:2'-5' RNA ligase family protein [Sphingobacteriales bacterium]MBI3718661.1 2'-5' RNA ligase family protein [Sphingobacteriales bacterium]
MTPSSPHNMYYVAIVCPTAINEKVQQYKLWMQQQFDCKVALKSPAHITLIAPFYFETIKESELITALEGFEYNHPPFTIQLNDFANFGKRVIFIQVVENKELESLHDSINIYFHQLFPKIIKKEDRSFHPHVTIANRDVKPSAFVKACEYFSERKFEESFTSNTISLLKLSDGKWNVIAQKEWTISNQF